MIWDDIQKRNLEGNMANFVLSPVYILMGVARSWTLINLINQLA